jgi:hypothetical protein
MHLSGKQFAADADVKQDVTSWLHSPQTDFFYARMQAWVTVVEQMFKCV